MSLPIFHELPQAQIRSRDERRVYNTLIKLIATLVKYKDIVNSKHHWTWGQEIEVYKISDELRELSRQYLGGHWDLSGPWEIVPYPTKWNDPLPAFALTTIQRLGYFDIVPDDQMGNHIHYRPMPTNIKTVYTWWKTYLNLYTLTILMIRMMSSHGTMLRSSWDRWAELSKEYPMRDLLDRYPSNEDLRYLLTNLRTIGGRDYYHITLNRHNKRTLTIEMRISETHPLKAWAFIYMVTKINKKFAKPLFLVTKKGLFEEFYRELADGEITDEEEIKWREIGLQPQFQWIDNIKTPKELTIKLMDIILDTTKPRDYLAKVIYNYIYKEGRNIVDKESVESFYEWLKGQKKEERVERNLLTILMQH